MIDVLVVGGGPAGLAAGRPDDYEPSWRKVSGPAWWLTAGLLWSRNQPLLASRLFSAVVNHLAQV
jgi:hypothetical protein